MAEFSANFHAKNFAAAARLDKEEYYNICRARREAEKKKQIHEGQEAGKNHAKVRALEASESEKTRKYLEIERNFARLELADKKKVQTQQLVKATKDLTESLQIRKLDEERRLRETNAARKSLLTARKSDIAERRRQRVIETDKAKAEQIERITSDRKSSICSANERATIAREEIRTGQLSNKEWFSTRRKARKEEDESLREHVRSSLEMERLLRRGLEEDATIRRKKETEDARAMFAEERKMKREQKCKIERAKQLERQKEEEARLKWNKREAMRAEKEAAHLSAARRSSWRASLHGQSGPSLDEMEIVGAKLHAASRQRGKVAIFDKTIDIDDFYAYCRRRLRQSKREVSDKQIWFLFNYIASSGKLEWETFTKFIVKSTGVVAAKRHSITKSSVWNAPRCVDPPSKQLASLKRAISPVAQAIGGPDFRNLFSYLGPDHTASLDADEFCFFCRDRLQINLPIESIASLFHSLDSEKTGTVSLIGIVGFLKS